MSVTGKSKKEQQTYICFQNRSVPVLVISIYNSIGRNNFQHCVTKNVGSYCVCIGSGVQTDATSPNNVRTCTASWEVYNPYDFINSKTMLNARWKPEQCCKSYANGSNIVALRFGDQGTKKIFELLARKFGRFQTLCNNSQQHATTCNRVSVFSF